MPEARTGKDSGIGRRRRTAQRDGGPTYAARREEIVQIGSHLFREKGYEATTLNEVAAAIGMDRASLYYYVRSKEELLQEIVRRVLEQNLEMAKRISGKRLLSSRQKLEELVDEMIVSFDVNYPHVSVYVEDMGRIARQDDEWSQAVMETTRQFEKTVMGILEKGQRDGSLRNDLPASVLAFALFGMVNWCHRWYRPGGGMSPQEIASAFLSIFLDGTSATARLDRPRR